ncbi:MAG: hypothetical protein LC778_08845 [Acidobacteria bacterium]|nr:hypothetical protein [Acidobacteriota bacterium]
MPKGTPRTRTETADALPLVSSKRGKYQELEKCELDAQVHADLMEYVEFVSNGTNTVPPVVAAGAIGNGSGKAARAGEV